MSTREAERSDPPRRAEESDERPTEAPARRGWVTARRAVLAIVLVCFTTTILDSVAVSALPSALPWLSGPGFLGACVLGALLVRRGDLLPLSACPPLSYFLGAVAGETALSHDSDALARDVTLGMGIRLAEAAPWLFLGTALVLLIGVFRGLATDIRVFSDELRGRHPHT